MRALLSESAGSSSSAVFLAPESRRWRPRSCSAVTLLLPMTRSLFESRVAAAYAYPLPFSLRLRAESAALLGLDQRSAPVAASASGRFNALVILAPRRSDTAAERRSRGRLLVGDDALRRSSSASSCPICIASRSRKAESDLLGMYSI